MYAESRYTKRKSYLKQLFRYQNKGYVPVYLDENGFETVPVRPYGYGHKSQLIYGKRTARTNLLLAQMGKNLLAPILFTAACNTAVFNDWLEKILIPELPPNSLVIMDNAATQKPKKSLKMLAINCFTYLLPAEENTPEQDSTAEANEAPKAPAAPAKKQTVSAYARCQFFKENMLCAGHNAHNLRLQYHHLVQGKRVE